VPYTEPTHAVLADLKQFGQALRAARRRVRLTQMELEEQSGVDQTLISRLERAKAAHCALDRILALHLALGRDLPLGSCPHDHDCQFKVEGQETPPNRRFSWVEALRSRD
jgi:transcriptional regulator with XRE-family HTH domain